MALTAAFVRTVKKPGGYSDRGAVGLQLYVKKSGRSYWVQRLTVNGMRRDIGLGSPPITTLADAREVAVENKRIARAGGDPLAQKRQKAVIPSFEQAARQVVVELGPTWRGAKEAASFISTMECYVFPRIGGSRVSNVQSSDVRNRMFL
ncbi:MAG: Arm DNA-binding domain-containing protein [Paracoccaceae bacterium]|nr:Arm DNA-binding domain-containing protein [Paracoccaceae bacterium]